MNSSISGKDLLLAIGEIREDLLEINTAKISRSSLYKRVAMIACFALIVSTVLLAYAGGIIDGAVGNNSGGDAADNSPGNDSMNAPNENTGSITFNDIPVSKYGFILEDIPEEGFFTLSADDPLIAFSFVYNGYETLINKIENGTDMPLEKREENGKTIIAVEPDSTYVIKNEAYINDIILVTESFGDANIKITYSYEAKSGAH